MEPGSTPIERCREGRGIKDWVVEQTGIKPFSPVPIKCGVDRDTAFIVEQEKSDMPGVDVVAAPIRSYPTGAVTASIVGYMARIPSPEDGPYFRDLYNQALSTLQEYVELEGHLPGEGSSRQQAGEFRLKLFPQGKSRSQEHVSAEGSYRLAPEDGQREFTLRFKSSGNSRHPSLPNDDVI